MSDFITPDNLTKTWNEYIAIVQELADLCGGKLDHHSVSTGRSFPSLFTPAFGVNPENILPSTTAIYAGHRDLFDFGKSKMLRTNERVWTSDYFQIQCVVSKKHNVYSMRLGRKGAVTEPQREDSFSHEIKLDFLNRSYSLKDWTEHKEDIEENIVKNLPEELAEKLQKELEKASEHKDKWVKQLRATIRELMDLTKETESLVNPAERYAALEIE